MGLEDVTNEIVDKAKEESKLLIKEARKKEAEIAMQINLSLNKIENQKIDELKNTIESMKRKEISQANLKSKKELMGAKKEILDESFKKATETIASMSDKKRKDLLNNILEKASKEIKVEYIYCNSEDIKLIKSGNHKVLAKKMLGGLILTSKDKSIVLDYSYDTMVDNIRNNNLQEIAAILF